MEPKHCQILSSYRLGDTIGNAKYHVKEILFNLLAIENRKTWVYYFLMLRSFLVVLFIAGLVVSADAQSFYARRRDRDLLLVLGTGTSTYLGELSNPGDYLDAEPNLVIGLQTNFTPWIGVRTEATWFRLSGSDAKAGAESRVSRNLSFFSNNLEVSATGVVNLFPITGRYYQRPTFNVYGFAGVALLRFNPKAEYKGDTYALQPLQTELVRYDRTVLTIPYGLGVKIKAGPFFNISLEGGLRKTFTDYLDDVSTVHHDASQFTDPLALALSDRGVELGYGKLPEGYIRGNPKTMDSYFLANIKLEYYLPVDFIFGNKLANSRSRKAYQYRRKQGGSFKKRRR